MARSKKNTKMHANHEEAWAIPYGDLVTLLLAFFVVMYAISSINEGKFRVLSDSLQAAFRGTPRTLVPVQVGMKTRGSGADIAVTIVQQSMIEGQPRKLLETMQHGHFRRFRHGFGAVSGRAMASPSTAANHPIASAARARRRRTRAGAADPG